MKAWLRRLAQSGPLQPLWRGMTHLAVRSLKDAVPPEHFAALHHDQQILLSKLGFGWGAHVEQSGEAAALEKARPKLASQPVMFDVGANRGDFTRLFLGHFPKAQVFCFEPSQQTFTFLQANLGSTTQARLLNFGLSDAAGRVPLYSDGAGSGLASVYARAGQELTPAETIELRTLDDVCAEENIARIDYLKMDVEGHELAVLKGAARMLAEGRVQSIQWEYGGCNLDSRTLLMDFFKLLAPRYDIWAILPGGLVHVPEYHFAFENFLTLNYLALRRD